MQKNYSRRGALGFGLGVLAAVCSGCKNDEIPLVKFPDNLPPPPKSEPPDPNGPQGVNTSKGEPAR